jgi:hypothetical protein
MPLKPKYQKILNEMKSKYGESKGEQIFFAWTKKENLNPELKTNYFLTEIKSIEGDVVTGYFATGNPDAYNDILSEECLEKMVTQLKSLKITIDEEHESFKNKGEGQKFRAIIPVAKVIDAELKGHKIEVKTLLNTAHSRYNEVKESIKNKFLHSFSFAYNVTDYFTKTIEGLKHRVINNLNLLNGCYTGIPVNDEASFVNVALKSLQEISYDEEEIKNLIGGVKMVEPKKEEKKEENDEEKKEENDEEKKPVKKEKKEDEEIEEPKKEEKKSKEPVKENEFKNELKSFSEELKAIKEVNAKLSEELKSINELKTKIQEFDKILSEPQFKAKNEQMKELIEKEEKKSKGNAGPLDRIK